MLCSFCQIYKSTKCNDMQQTGYCPRGPFCAFAHVDRKYLLMIQIYVHFVLLYNMGKSFFCMSLALLVNKISLSGPSTETIHWQCGFLNWLRKEISSIMASQLNQCPINILKVFLLISLTVEDTAY